MLQAFVNMIKFPQELSLLNLVSEVRYQQELSKSIQNSEQGFCAAETEMIHFAFKCFSVMHQTAAMEENDRRREADRQVFYKCLTWSEVLPTILLFLISFYFPYSVHLSFERQTEEMEENIRPRDYVPRSDWRMNSKAFTILNTR